MRYPLFFFACMLLTTPVEAADLRVETRVYESGETEPISESTTLFQDGVVYDLRPEESRVTIYRPGARGKAGRFILLDTERRVRTEIGVARVAAVMDKLRDWADQQDDPFLKFTASPRFEESFDADTGELRLVSDQMSYRLVTLPTDHPEMKLAVREFLDRFTQLQTLLDAGLPPEPRLRVNEALYRHGLMPIEVEVSDGRLKEGASPLPDLRAEHLTAWVLSKQDRRRIEEAVDQMASFPLVENAEFHRGRKAVAAK